MKNHLWLVGSLLFSLPACTSIHYLPAQSVTYPPTAQVEVLLEKPTKSYTVLGLVIAETQPLISGISQFTTEEDLLEEVKTKAKEIGANAIVVTHVGHSQVLRSSPNYATGGSHVSSKTMRRVEAVAIRFDVLPDTATK